MPGMLTKIWFTAALALTGLPALGAGMPDSGTKNFTPGGDAPSYLTNENLVVAPGSAAQSPVGTGFNQTAGQTAASAPTAAAAIHSVQTRTRRHGALAAGRKQTHHLAANTRIKRGPSHIVSTRRVRESRSAGLGRNARPVRSASRAASAARTRTATHGKANTQHAAAKSAARKG